MKKEKSQLTDRITIPPEAVEAAARARYEKMCSKDGMTSPMFPKWEELKNPLRSDYLDEEEAALIAGLKAWPGMADIPATRFADGAPYPRVIHLPFPLTEAPDAE